MTHQKWCIVQQHSHQWLDENGWDYRTAYAIDKNGRIYEMTLNIAKAKDGRNILYDINKIKKIDDGIVPSKAALPKHQSTEFSIPQNSKNASKNLQPSLSNQNTTPLQGTNGRDLMLNNASLPDDIPIRQDIAPKNIQQNMGPVREDVKNITPVEEVEEIEAAHRQQIEELDQQISEINTNDIYVSANNKSRVNNFQSAIEGYKNARAEIETTFDNQISKKQSVE